MNRVQLISYMKSVIFPNSSNQIDATKHQALEERILTDVMIKSDDIISDDLNKSSTTVFSSEYESAQFTLKVDKVTGKSLIADTEITRLAGINDHYRGTYLTKVAIELAIPIGNAGDEATVDAGVGSDPIKYIWDVSDNAWKQGGGGSVTVDQSVINGSTNAVSGGAVYNELELVQKKTDNALSTSNKTVVGAINELNEQISANQLTFASVYGYYNFI